MKATPEFIERLKELAPCSSISEMALSLNCAESTVSRLLKAHGISRDASQLQSIRVRTRKRLIRDERRRTLFGLEQKTNLKVFSNRERLTIKNLLKRKGYVFQGRGSVVALYTPETLRNPVYEERGRKLGLRFQSLNPTSIPCQ